MSDQRSTYMPSDETFDDLYRDAAWAFAHNHRDPWAPLRQLIERAVLKGKIEALEKLEREDLEDWGDDECYVTGETLALRIVEARGRLAELEKGKP